MTIALTPELYPFWAQGRTIAIKGIEFLAEASKTTVTVTDKSNRKDTLVRNPSLGNLAVGSLSKIPLPAAISDTTHPPLSLSFDDTSMQDMWMAITWGKA